MKYYFINHTPCKCNKEKAGQTEITEAQYNAYVEAIRNFDLTAPEGQYYRLEEDCTWKLYALPVSAAGEELSDTEALNNNMWRPDVCGWTEV